MVEYNRPADFVERALIYRAFRGNYRNFNISAKFANKVDAVVLSNALKELVRKNLILSYNFHTDSKLHFTETSGSDYELRTPEYIRFEDVVSFEKIDKFDAQYVNSLNDIIVPHNVKNHPVWRIKVVETSDGDQWIVAVFDHALFDGMSGNNFLTKLSKECSKVTSSELEERIFDRERDADVVPEVPIPASEKCHLYDIRWTDKVRVWLASIFGKLSNAYSYLRSFFPYHKILGNTYVNPGFRYDLQNRDLGTGIISFTPNELDRIVKRCRSKGVTVGIYVQTLAIKSIEESIINVIRPTPLTHAHNTAMNFRRYLDPVPEFEIANYSTNNCISLSPIAGREWEAMKFIKRQLDDEIKSRSKLFFIFLGLFKFQDIVKSMDAYENSPLKTSGISNLGVMEDTPGKYEIVDAVFSQSSSTNHFGINMISTKLGGLNVALTWQDEYERLYSNGKKVTDSLCENFRDSVYKFLED